MRLVIEHEYFDTVGSSEWMNCFFLLKKFDRFHVIAL